MSTPTVRAVRLAAVTATSAIVLAAANPDSAAFRHERKEVAGLAIVFGAEPEPALTEEMQFLRWRVSTLADETPYESMTGAEVKVTFDGEEYGPFPVRPVRGSAGQYQTRHIFTVPGEYQSLLTFRKGEGPEVHSVDFTFTIRDRTDMEIPRRRGGGG